VGIIPKAERVEDVRGEEGLVVSIGAVKNEM